MTSSKILVGIFLSMFCASVFVRPAAAERDSRFCKAINRMGEAIERKMPLNHGEVI